MKPSNAWRLLAAVTFTLLTAPSAVAHHAIQAEYEMSKTGSFTGVMTRFAMINPHCRWFFEETKPDGSKVAWEMSGAGPGAREEHRWWPQEEIAKSEDDFAPRAFAEHLEHLLTHGPPTEPIEVGR